MNANPDIDTAHCRRMIVFEGGEGSGKSTQVQALSERLGAASQTVITTREPGGTDSAERIRALLVEGATDAWQPMTEVLLHYAARVEHLQTLLLPALKRGDWVICDRFRGSTLAYQGGGHGVDASALTMVDDAALAGFRPGLTVLLDIDVDAGLARAKSRADAEDRYERMGAAFHHRVRDAFLAQAAVDPTTVVIDASLPLDTVFAHVWQAVIDRFGVFGPVDGTAIGDDDHGRA